MRHNGVFKDWKEIRRRRANQLEAKGWRQCDIAEALGVSKGAVSQWINSCASDAEGWRSKPQGHRPSKLTEQQRRSIPDLLSHGAEAYGFRGELWTCARIAEVIREEFGVAYHKAHVSRLLRALQWTPQLPLERALQRDEGVIERWREEAWPALKKRLRKRAP